MDSVKYHPLYKDIRPRFDWTRDDPVYLTTALEDHTFYLPEGEEWISSEQAPTSELAIRPKEYCVVADPFEPRNMLPYLSPSKLVPEEERESEQEYRSWREYMSSSTNSLDQFAKTYQAKKPSRRKSKTPSNQMVDQGEAPSSTAQVEPAVPTQVHYSLIRTSWFRIKLVRIK